MPKNPPLQVSFNRPIMVGNENEYMAQAIEAAKFSGDGPFTRKASELLEQQLGVPKVLLTTSCTHALEMFALLLDIQPGDEVILPSFTFVSTVNAFVLRGARPVFADIRPDTLNLDEAGLEALITPRTKAIVPVHYAGVGCEMDAILEIAGRHGRLPWWKTMPTGCSANTRAAISARSACWRRRVSTRPRISPAARAARC
jgi:dTDP-4-amino-4,6-dideoxygalactose transaminase